jgi:hypothetical protein
MYVTAWVCIGLTAQRRLARSAIKKGFVAWLFLRLGVAKRFRIKTNKKKADKVCIIIFIRW